MKIITLRTYNDPLIGSSFLILYLHTYTYDLQKCEWQVNSEFALIPEIN